MMMLSDATVSARKAHRCDQCGLFIEPGQHYRRVAIKDGSDLYTFKEHEDCGALATSIWEASGSFLDEYPDLRQQEPETINAWRGYYPHAVNRFYRGED